MYQKIQVLKEKLRSNLFRNTVYSAVGFAFRLGVQILYFLLVARTLQPESYGIFAGVLALSTVLSPFVAWGSGNLLILHTARDPKAFAKCWGGGIAATLFTATLFAAIALGVSGILWGGFHYWRLVLVLCAADFLAAKFTDLSAQAFQAFQRLDRSSLMYVLQGTSKLLFALLFFFAPVPRTAEVWAWLYLAGNAMAAVIALLIVRHDLGWGPMSFVPIMKEWKRGFYFSVGLSAQGMNNDIDKSLMLRFSSSAETGAYSVAYKIMNVAFLPVVSLFWSSYPRFFQAGAQGVRGSLGFAKRILPWAVGCGLLSALALLALTPILPWLLGAGYSLSAAIIPWLLPLVVLRTLHYIAADTLTGADLQHIRSWMQIVIAVFNLTINLVLIPLFGWRGAVISSLISDSVLAILLWIVVLRKSVRPPEPQGGDKYAPPA